MLAAARCVRLQTANYLKDTWVVTLKNAIKSSFKDVGKGWFNLHESNMETWVDARALCGWATSTSPVEGLCQQYLLMGLLGPPLAQHDVGRCHSLCTLFGC